MGDIQGNDQLNTTGVPDLPDIPDDTVMNPADSGERRINRFYLCSMMLYVVLGLVFCLIYFRVSTSGPKLPVREVDQVGAAAVVGILSEADSSTEEDTSDTGEEQGEEEIQVRFYRFTTSNRRQMLHVRREPGMTGFIMYRLRPGTNGHILQKGSEWSYVVTPGLKEGDADIIGYCYNGYLAMEEIQEEDYPQQYRETVRSLYIPEPPAE